MCGETDDAESEKRQRKRAIYVCLKEKIFVTRELSQKINQRKEKGALGKLAEVHCNEKKLCRSLIILCAKV